VKNFRIFQAGLDDISDLQTIEIASGLSPWTLLGYQSELRRSDAAAFVARTDKGEAVGFIIGRIPPLADSVAEIYNIGTLAHVRRLGIGKSLLAQFLDKCREQGVSEVWLEARISNQEAINFYRNTGFETNGIRRNFYDNPAEDAQLMTLRLIQGPPLTKS
jgi:ribosomal-protein-alanine N-acetyltransferase